MTSPTRRLAAIVAMDVAGYSRLMGRDEQGTLRRLTEHRTVIDPIGREHGGRIVGTAGDGVLVEFPSVVEAVHFALRCQSVMAERNEGILDDEKMLFRIGINLGDVLVQDDDIFGDGVNVAARIEGLAEPGGICISRTVRDNIRDKLDAAFEDMGDVEVKNIARPIRVFRISANADAIAGIKPVGLPGVSKEPNQRPNKRLLNIAAGVALLLIVCIGSLWWWQDQYSDDTAEMTSASPQDSKAVGYDVPKKPSLAVLPFDNLSGDSKQDFIGDGLTENMIAMIASTPNVDVIARNSTFVYKGKATNVQDIAEELGVRYVLEGSVQAANDRIRVTAQLIDGLSGNHIWAETFDRKMEDLFSVQDDISVSVLEALQIKFSYAGERVRYWRRMSGHPEAYLLLMQALPQILRWDAKGHIEGERLLKRAYDIAPNSPVIRVYMGWVYYEKASLWLTNDRQGALKKARALAEKVMSEKESVDAHALLSSLDSEEGNHDAAMARGDRLLELAPADPKFVHHAGLTKILGGQPKEGVILLRRARELGSYTPPIWLFAASKGHMMLGELEEARRLMEPAAAVSVEEWGINIPAWALQELAIIAVFAGDIDKAKSYANRSLELLPNTNVEGCRFVWTFLKDRAFHKRYCDAMQQAGFPDKTPSSQ